jgi:DNA-binding NarL/FixJ family response regulator
MSRVRIVIADDHSLFRDGLIALFSSDQHLEVVGEASDGAGAIAAVARLVPDVLLLDVSMPGIPALTTIQNVRHRSPRTRVAILTMHDERALRHSLLDAGASAFWSKSVPSRRIMENIKELVMSPWHDKVEYGRGRRPAAGLLSAREIDVIRLVGSALSNKEVACRLGIAEGTVKRHMSSIFEKLGATTRLDAVRKAARQGITVLE